MASIIPAARALVLCDNYVGGADGKADLVGIFEAIRPKASYPYTGGRFCVFTQLANGLGQVEIHLQVRYAPTDEIVWSTPVHTMTFPDRKTVVKLAVNVQGCRFERAGVYWIELVCNNTWVCDTQIFLL